jgi:hypothetical protein
LEKGSYPTITVIDSIEPNQNDQSARRNCCGCVPERFGVFAILSVYLFFGLCGITTSFGGLASANQTSDIIFLIISGLLNVFLTIISALGINAIKKEKAVMMYRLSITFWVFTVFTLIFSATLFILDIVYKSSIVKDCEESLESLKINTSSDSFDDTDCNHVANVYLVKEAIRLFFIETISIYFACVIFKYANRMLKKSQKSSGFARGECTKHSYIFRLRRATTDIK